MQRESAIITFLLLVNGFIIRLRLRILIRLLLLTWILRKITSKSHITFPHSNALTATEPTTRRLARHKLLDLYLARDCGRREFIHQSSVTGDANATHSTPIVRVMLMIQVVGGGTRWKVWVFCYLVLQLPLLPLILCLVLFKLPRVRCVLKILFLTKSLVRHFIRKSLPKINNL